MQLLLYHFFQTLKNRTTIPLTAEQYVDFIRVFVQMPSNAFADVKDLRAFVKLFWLADVIDEKEFNSLFDKWIVKTWEPFAKNAIQDIEEVAPRPDPDPEPNPKPPIKDPPFNPPIDQKKKPDTPIIPNLENEYEDFELVIEEDDTKTPTSQAVHDNFKDYQFSQTFQLNDQQIMPFSIRYLSQRARALAKREKTAWSTEMDIPIVIKGFAENGFIDHIDYQKKVHNYTNIVLLVDRFGSMLSYEFLETQWQRAFKMIPKVNFEQYFFYNIPQKTSTSTAKHYEMRNAQKGNALFNTQKHTWTKDTHFFIFSDAGAHSGLVNKKRIIASLDFWRYLQNISDHVFWLNPVPKEQMNDCTARRLQFSIPMIYPGEEQLERFFKQHRYVHR